MAKDSNHGPWSSAAMRAEADQVAKSLERLAETRSTKHLLERLLDEELLKSPSNHPRLVTLAILALRHHGSRGGLTPAQIDMISNLADRVLKTNGLLPGSSKSAHLYGDLSEALASAHSYDGRSWRATLASHKAGTHRKLRGDDAGDRRQLAAAESALSHGHALVSLAHLGEASAGPDALILSIKANRLAGKTDHARDALALLSGSPDLSVEQRSDLAWEGLVLDKLMTGNPRDLSRAFRNQKDSELDRYGLDAWLWTRAHSAADANTAVASLRRIRERQHLFVDRIAQDHAGFRCAQLIEQCYDSDLSMDARLDLAISAVEEASLCATFDRRLLVVAAVARWLSRTNQLGLAAMVLAEYQGLCLTASGGAVKDTLNCLGEMSAERLAQRAAKPLKATKIEDETEKPVSSLSDLLDIVRILVTAFGLAARGSLRKVLVSANEGKQIELEHEVAIARLAADFLKRRKGLLLKVGQVISYVDGPIENHVLSELEVLQANVEPMSYRRVERVFKESFGRLPGEMFLEFSETPVAAGSIGQVHRAKLPNGREVAVKVQYPDARRLIEIDLKRTRLCRRFIKSRFPLVDYDAMIAEGEEHLLAETDYRRELENIEEFRRIFAEDPAVEVPMPHRDFSNDRVLTVDWAKGQSFSEFVETGSQEERNRAGATLMRIYCKSFGALGVFNADPHPGNYKFDGGRVQLLDFGCVKRFPADFLRRRNDLTKAFFSQDKDRFAQAYVAFGLVSTIEDLDVERAFQAFTHVLGHSMKDKPYRFPLNGPDSIYRSFSGSEGMAKFFCLPRHLLLALRVEFGLNSVLARLGAEVNWRRIFLPYIYGESPLPPPFPEDEQKAAS